MGTKEDFLWEGVDLQSIEVEGSLETYFEDFEFDIQNAVDDTEEVADVELTATVKRLNHKPFSWKMQVENSKGAAAVASARIYMCPRRDANGVAYHPNSGRWGCIEMDKFYVELAPGANTILRDAKMSTVTIPDIPSFNYIKEKTDAAIASGSLSSGLEEYARGCGIHGQKVPDKRAMGYPLDRPILDFRMTASIPNFKTDLVKVYHKPSE